MRRFQILSLSMPLVVLTVFLLIMFYGKVSQENPVKIIWEEQCQEVRVPAWGIIKDGSELMALFPKILEDILEIEVNFHEEMLLYLVTGATDEGLGGYVIKRIRQEDEGFSVLCSRENIPDGEHSVCHIALIPKMKGNVLFQFE